MSEEIVEVWMRPKLVKMIYKQHPDGGASLIPIDGETVVATREIKPAPQAKGLPRRGNVERWDFQERKRKA